MPILISLPSGSAEDLYISLVEEHGEAAIARLLEECGAVQPVELAGVATELEHLAAALADAMLDDDLGAPLGLSPHSALRDHSDFPWRLGQRVLGALHLHDVLGRSASGALLAGLLARQRMLDGEVADALAMGVLAVAVGSGSGSAHTRLCMGVIAAALLRAGHRRAAAGLHLQLWSAGIEVEAWREAESWSPSAPWTDGTRFEEPHAWFPHTAHRVPMAIDDPRSSYVQILEESVRKQRFGLDRFLRIHRRAQVPEGVMLRDLEDLAIQEGWEFL
jgi:hypothetical protein